MRAEKDQTCSQTIRKRRYSTEIKEGVDRGRWLAAVYTGFSYRPGTG